jgi:hypothetical protein
MSAPFRLPAQAATPTLIKGGARVTLETLEVHNPHASDGAYVKVYVSDPDTAPDGSAIPTWGAWIAGGASRTLAPFIEGSNLWIAVATQAGAGLTAPTTAFEISATLG